MRMGRGEGKTTLAIKRAHEKGAIIISPFPKYVKTAAKGKDVEVVGVSEVHKLLGRSAPVIVDDADVVLRHLISEADPASLLECLLRWHGVINTELLIFNHD